MSTYFDESLNRIATGALARSTHVNGFKDAVGVAFDMLPEPTEISQGTATLGVESGAADAYVLTMPITLTSYTTGNEIVFVPGNTNTGASVVNVDGLGSVGLKRANGDDLSAGELVAGLVYSFRYNGSAYQYMGFSSTEAFATSAAASAAAAAASAAAAYSSQGYSFEYAEASNVSRVASVAAAAEAAASAAAALVSENNAETAETNAAASVAALTGSVITKTQADSPYTVIVSDLSGRKTFVNTAASGACELQLPAGAVGYRCKCYVAAAQSFGFKANGSEVFRMGSIEGAAGGTILADTIGSLIEIEWFGGKWQVDYKSGIWTYSE